MSDELSTLWDQLCKTDPAQTKGFKRAGGFTGTALKPMWAWKRLTEHFGPFGLGWGCQKPEFQLVPAGNELLVFCTVEGWWKTPDNKVYGVGGDKVLAVWSSGPKADDEAFKKAYTDALMNAFKFIGIGADIHMGAFDDSKYVEAVNAEFRAEEEAQAEAVKVPGIHKIKERQRALKTAGAKVDTLDAFNALVKERADDLTAIKDASHAWWTGDGGEDEGFRSWIKGRREQLDPENMINRMIADMRQCETPLALSRWMGAQSEAIEALGDIDGRMFQAAADAHEAKITPSTVTAG